MKLEKFHLLVPTLRTGSQCQFCFNPTRYESPGRGEIRWPASGLFHKGEPLHEHVILESLSGSRSPSAAETTGSASAATATGTVDRGGARGPHAAFVNAGNAHRHRCGRSPQCRGDC